MDVLLVNPPFEKDYVRVERCMQSKDAWSSLWQPIQLCYAQAVLEEKGYKTKLVDYIAEDLSFDDLKRHLEDLKPKFVVINTAIPTIENDLRVAELSKKISNSKTVAIGMATKIIPEELSKNKYLDSYIIGEAEAAILDFIRGKKGPLKKDVDFKNLPFPCFKDLKHDKYTMPFSGERMALVVPSRGCVFDCSFCLVPVYYGKKVKFRRAKHIVDEIERDIKEYGIKNFLFWAETFTMNKNFVFEICEEILDRNLKIKWMAPSRADTIDKKMLNIMKKSGCFMLSFGVESLNQEVLDKINKKVKVSQIEYGIKLCRDLKIDIMAHVIVGLPGQTEKSVKRTIERLIELDTSYIQTYCAVPYPKTDLYKMAVKNNWILDTDLKNYEINMSVMQNENMNPEEIQNLRNWCYTRFYFRPKLLIKQFLKNPSYRLILDGTRFFLGWVKR